MIAGHVLVRASAGDCGRADTWVIRLADGRDHPLVYVGCSVQCNIRLTGVLCLVAGAWCRASECLGMFGPEGSGDEAAM